MVEPVDLLTGQVRPGGDGIFHCSVFDRIEGIGNEINARLEAGVIPADQLPAHVHIFLHPVQPLPVLI